jgi:hypothetical protein
MLEPSFATKIPTTYLPLASRASQASWHVGTVLIVNIANNTKLLILVAEHLLLRAMWR